MILQDSLLISLVTYVMVQHCICVEDQDKNQTESIVDGGSDIILTQEQQLALELLLQFNDYNMQNAVINIINIDGRWTDGIVPYKLHASLSSKARAAISAAIAEYEAKTCLRFKQRKNESDYVHFYKGSGCFSNVGRVGGAQPISIGRYCDTKGIVLHEIFHALGRWHEHSRPDRDEYVQINYEYILSRYASNFMKLPSTFVSTQGIGYDFGSIMHYPQTAFTSSKEKRSIVPLMETSATLGQRKGLSQSDIKHVKALYCSSGNTITSQWTTWSSWSVCSLTCNKGIRHRTRHCVGGNSNCPGSNVDYEFCNTNPCPTAAKWSQWSEWSQCSSTCGVGKQARTRRCLNGNNCDGVMLQYEDCNTQPCPEPASWSSWEAWSKCSKSCGGGMQVRQRTCQNGNTCPGLDTAVKECNKDVICPMSSKWTEWTSCSRTCSGGTRKRSRNCEDPTSTRCEYQLENCNQQSCPSSKKPAEIKSLGCYKFLSRVRSIEKKTPKLQDYPPTRAKPVEKCAEAAEYLGYKMFGVAEGFCVSGSNEITDYQQVRGDVCKDGRGGYYRGFYMDVYRMQDQAQQSSSDADDSSSNIDPIEENESIFSGEEPSSSCVISSSLLLLAVLALFSSCV